MTLGNNGNQTRKRLADPVREHSCNGIFGRKMTGIYQRQAERLCTLHQVIRAVADYKGISALRERAVHQLATRAAADRYAPDWFAAVAEAHAACTQAFLDEERKFARLHLVRHGRWKTCTPRMKAGSRPCPP